MKESFLCCGFMEAFADDYRDQSFVEQCLPFWGIANWPLCVLFVVQICGHCSVNAEQTKLEMFVLVGKVMQRFVWGLMKRM